MKDSPGAAHRTLLLLIVDLSRQIRTLLSSADQASRRACYQAKPAERRCQVPATGRAPGTPRWTTRPRTGCARESTVSRCERPERWTPRLQGAYRPQAGAQILTRFAPCPPPAGGSALVTGSRRAAPWGDEPAGAVSRPTPSGRHGSACAVGTQKGSRPASRHRNRTRSSTRWERHKHPGEQGHPRDRHRVQGGHHLRCAAAPKGSDGILTTYRRSRNASKHRCRPDFPALRPEPYPNKAPRGTPARQRPRHRPLLGRLRPQSHRSERALTNQSSGPTRSAVLTGSLQPGVWRSRPAGLTSFQVCREVWSALVHESRAQDVEPGHDRAHIIGRTAASATVTSLPSG
jgi:hypothetical protein